MRAALTATPRHINLGTPPPFVSRVLEEVPIAAAATELFRRLGGEVVGVAGIIDLPELGGSAKLRAAGLNVHTLCEFNETE